MRLLVAIANHGVKNRKYLDHLIDTYNKFSFHVDIVVLSDQPKDLGPDIEVLVGAPIENPWSLPFGHRKLFVDRQDAYDLFIYSEDDTEITEAHVQTFLKSTEELPDDLIPGFLRYEIGPDDTKYCSTIHGPYHWDPNSIQQINGRTWAHYTNDHAASYILTQAQLKTCIASGGFDIPPHEGLYDMLCSAATDPYVRCGLRKVICVSELDDFMIRHLPDIYLGRIGMEWPDFMAQIDRIVELAGDDQAKGDQLKGPICRTRSDLPTIKLARNYCTPTRADVLQLTRAHLSPQSRILSVGSDIGNTEAELKAAGHDVTAIPLDAIVAASVERRGIRTVAPDLEQARETLSSESFHLILFNDILTFLLDPDAVIGTFLPLLAAGGRALVAFENYGSPLYRRQLRRRGFGTADLESEQRKGLHLNTVGTVRSWLSKAGLASEQAAFHVENRHQRLVRFSAGLARPFVAKSGAVLSASTKT